MMIRQRSRIAPGPSVSADPSPAGRRPRTRRTACRRFADLPPAPPAGATCACRFLGNCPAYNDPLIDPAAKGPAGRGCRQQTDAYRKHHCHAFACKLLAALLAPTGGPR